VITIADQGQGKVIVRHAGAEYVLPFADPFTPHDQEDMRWYLEDFQLFPYGGDKWRADQIRQRFVAGGQQIFDQLFDGSGASVFREASKSGLQHVEIAVRSNDPRFLSIPWELIRSPDARIGYLASHVTGIYRQRVLDSEPEAHTDHAEGPLRMLLVISRPDGTASVPLGSVAGPIINAVRPLRGLIDVEVLRPPTFENFCNALGGKKRYHLVHFDGHGAFVERSEDFRRYASDKGYVLFETPNHECDPVSSDRLAAAIPKKWAPIFLLNACRSAREGDLDPFASVAAQLVLAGSPSVVAMSFSVYVGTASRFMTGFYHSLLGGSSVVAATTAGRNAIREFGKQEQARLGYVVEDWIVPAAYVQRPETMLHKATTVLPERHFNVAKRQANPLARHEDMLEIERAMIDGNRPVVFLSGVVGEGKTELAKGFADWWTETGGCEKARYVDSQGEADIGTVFRSLVGEENDTRDTENLIAAVSAQLKNTAILLVWDHPEAVLNNGADRTNIQIELTSFFKSLESAKGRLMVVSRQDCEEWLPSTCQTVTMRDMPNEVVGRFLVEAVADHGGAARLRSEAGLTKLIHAIGWHAATMKRAGEALAHSPMITIAERLEQGVPQPDDELLDPTVNEIFESLTPRTKMHLPLLGLFGKGVIPSNLGVFTGGGMKQHVYREVSGQAVSKEEWQKILDEAALVGLVRSMWDRKIFELPAMVRFYLRGRLKEKFGEHLATLRDGVCAFYGGVAMIWQRQLLARDSGILAAVSAEEGSLSESLHHAVLEGHWKYAVAILQLFEMRFDDDPDIVMGIVQDVYGLLRPGFPENDTEQQLWCSIRLAEAGCAEKARDRVKVKKIALDVLERIGKRPTPEFLIYVASCHRHLGYSAVGELDYEKAESHFTCVREIAEQTADNRLLSTASHALGILAQSRYQLDLAKDLFQKALSLDEADKDIVGACNEYHHLGMLAKIRGEYDEAENWFLQALRIRERLGIRAKAASDQFLLGEVAESRGDLVASRRWFLEALKNYIELRMNAQAASAGHRLAMVLEQQNELEEASEWCRWSLEILRHLERDLLEGHAYHELGIIAIKKDELQHARDEFQRALGIYERLNSVEHIAGSHLALGSVARAENNLEVAKREFLEALGGFEALNHPRLLQKPLMALGELAVLENDDKLAIERLGQALEITKTWNLGADNQTLQLLAPLLQRLGDRQFQVLWKAVGLGNPPPLEAIRAVPGPASG
jgi:tetratricopeptide (TPR) repeat protein